MEAPVALVTGCSSGIGAATVRELAGRRWRVAATGRRPEALTPLESLPGVTLVPLDVCDHESVVQATKRVADDIGPVRALVNNAGYGLLGPIEEADLDAVRRQFETNVIGLLDVTQQVLPIMRERRQGVIVNISSVAGIYSNPFGGVYAASKFAVEALSDALRLEVAPWGLRVVVVEPGPIQTDFDRRAKAESVTSSRDDSPYQPWLDQLEGQADGVIDRVQKSAEHCARVIADAVEAKRPRARYRVTLPAHVFPIAQRLLPSRAIDAGTRRMFGLHREA
jgi:NAD(P)-dependent dehydrogenase (short-subunit alcohol dehydrogenase family)